MSLMTGLSLASSVSPSIPGEVEAMSLMTGLSLASSCILLVYLEMWKQ